MKQSGWSREIRPLVPADRCLIAGAGRDSTRATIAAVARAARAGADLVLVRVPTAFKGQMTADALERHYVTVADQSPVPVLLYDFPQGFGVTLPIAVLVKLAGHPNIVGLKESSGDLSQIAEQAARTPRDFVLVVGSAPTLYASLLVGAAGGVVAVANVIPELCAQLVDLVDAGRHDDALALQRAIAPLAQAVTSGHGVPALKAAMTLAGYRGGWPRAPLPSAGPAVVDDLAGMLASLAPARAV